MTFKKNYSLVNNSSSYVDEAFLRIEELLEHWMRARGPDRDLIAKGIFTSILIVLNSESALGGVGVYDLLKDYMLEFFPGALRFKIAEYSKEYVQETVVDVIKNNPELSPFLSHRIAQGEPVSLGN